MKLSKMLESIGIDTSLNKDFEVKALAPLESALENEVSYIDQNKYLSSLKESKAGAVLIKEKDVTHVPSHMQSIVVPNPHLAFAKLSAFFAKDEFAYPTAEKNQIQIGENTTIMPNVFLGNNVKIGKNCTLMPGVVISDNVNIGDGCKIFPNVVIYRDTHIGSNVFIHAGTIIGSDGFGYAHNEKGEHVKIQHNGKVVIENDVEIGANNTIDRAVFGETRIKKGSKIDNLVQIGHNCTIGEHTLLVSQVGLAGSTSTGRNVVMGGQAGTGGHIHIGDFTQIAGRGAVGKNLPPNTKWGGHPLMELDEWMKFFVTLRRMVKKKSE
ncbi:UDP-3-O-(3-hydroxymyristoyl)glucosamine N-acyltransferase [Helicobacter cappadocius]|uniref:UDP-3-O-acylglucosamine N-acyltransferase n=1 Tax=Helicobacter cappadocius TaxID=3063998 RepID=A0AA90PQJ4_9HELI|nr:MULTISPECIES: UDP-3-O-(3-hydroxymyristoyl)glucosamine N-acyltransferase [unclassified Helicobacter]MDO7252465.1 UDP-3-O-(3-hydroxymyristoyl)glucosamine N-acyltransferase [Helicobacter sp. faydin-H75]MDP2538332.1 UDP-3-O-(3-hydroxymyristoyl)glucosamine N-acyltransferase [Helicobacter sp. faydin-H76]